MNKYEDDEYGEFLKKSFGGLFKIVGIIFLVLLFAPAWPLLIIIPLIGLGMGGGSRSFWD